MPVKGLTGKVEQVFSLTYKEVDMELLVEIKLRDEKHKPLVFQHSHQTKSVTDDVLYKKIQSLVAELLYPEQPK